MMISHGDAISLETIVRNITKCDRYGFGGLIDADIYEANPLEASIICVALLYHNKYDDQIAEYFRKWRFAFRDAENSSELSADEYITELRELVKLLQS